MLRLMLVGILLFAVGCEEVPPYPDTPPEATFERQLLDVSSAATDSIQVTKSVVPLQLLQHLDPTLKLRELRLDQTPITDAEAEKIAAIESLEIVNLPASELTDEGLAKIAALPKLELLRIGSPNITDAAIAKVGENKSILYLHLLHCPITDGAIDSIAQLEQLQSFYADDTKLTDEGVSKLVKARPKLHIHFNDLHPEGSSADHSHDHDHGHDHAHGHDHDHSH
ncbi:hypothetical protein [Bremerella cremea]|uniref:hypothetical protein n=1 Tax=Bremerella cremea TaxID=1031537 RepID=UPI0031E69F07